MSAQSSKKRILVIGATGDQGRPVVRSLLSPQKDGAPSPYTVRALTRDSKSDQAKELAAMGAELFEGRFDNMESIAAAYEGCYGAFVNTDTFSVGEEGEVFAGIKIFEQAHRTPEMKHFIWSALDYGSKLGNYDPKYHSIHLDAKGIVSDFLRSQPSSPSLTWSIITTGPYIENLGGILLGPLPRRDSSGAVVFSVPTGNGHIPTISLEDIGWWARYTFDHRAETSGQDLKIATEMMTMDQVVETFTRVTGIPAVRKQISLEEYLNIPEYAPFLNRSIVSGQDGPTIAQAYYGMWNVWGDDLITRDMEWNRRIHPTGYTLESWIREKKYDGSIGVDLRFIWEPAKETLQVGKSLL